MHVLTLGVITYNMAGMSTACDGLEIPGDLAKEARHAIAMAWAKVWTGVGAAVKPLGISPAQYDALRVLREAGKRGLRRGEVAERMVVRTPAGTRVLRQLEAAGLAARLAGDVDRRIVRSRITTQGLGAVARADREVAAQLYRRFAAFNRESLERLLRLLSRLQRSVAAEECMPDGPPTLDQGRRE